MNRSIQSLKVNYTNIVGREAATKKMGQNASQPKRKPRLILIGTTNRNKNICLTLKRIGEEVNNNNKRFI